MVDSAGGVGVAGCVFVVVGAGGGMMPPLPAGEVGTGVGVQTENKTGCRSVVDNVRVTGRATVSIGETRIVGVIIVTEAVGIITTVAVGLSTGVGVGTGAGVDVGIGTGVGIGVGCGAWVGTGVGVG